MDCKRSVSGRRARGVLSEAITRLLVEQPFYGFFLQAFVFQQTDTATETMGVGYRKGRVRCVYNAAFVCKLTPTELEAVLVHEVLHVVHRHPLRRVQRNPFLFNLASDQAINPKIQGLPEGALFPPDELNGASAEHIYEHLARSIATEIDRLHQGQDPLDDHDFWHEMSEHPWEAEVAIHQAVRYTHTKSQGRVPGEISEDIRWWLSCPQISWRQMLKDFLSLHALTEKTATHTRRNRRVDVFGLPGYRKHYRAHIAVAVDTSGSVSESELNLLFSEIESLSLEIPLVLLMFDAEVYRITTYRRGDYKKLGSEICRGGTDFFPVFECVERSTATVDGSKISSPVDCLVLLTDGYATYPESATIPVLWVLTPNHNPELPPFGRTAVLEDH